MITGVAGDAGGRGSSPIASRTSAGLVGRGAVVWAVSSVVLAWGAWRPAWSIDEGASAMVVRRTFAQVLATSRFDPALEPYYLLLKVWSLPSTSEFWLRLPSVLAMAGAVTAVWVLVRRLASERAGVFAVLVMLVMPATTRYGQEARPYALTVLLVVLVVVCWDDDRLPASRRWQALVAVLVALAGAAHAYALLIVPVLVVVSGLAPRAERRRELIATAAAGAVGLLLLAPYILAVALRAQGSPHPVPVTVENVAMMLQRLPAHKASPSQVVPIAVAVLVLAAVGVALSWFGSPRGRRAAVLGAVWLFLPPLTLVLFQVATGSPGLIARYWLFCLPAIALTAALTLDWLSARSLGLAVACAVGLCALALPGQVAFRGDNGHNGQPYRDLSRVLALPGLGGAALLAEGSHYRTLVSNDPSLATRMPLVIDPTASGRFNPLIAKPDSEKFARLARDHDVVVVLQNPPPGANLRPPITAQSFPGFRKELRAFPTAAVLCTYFGEPLGVFTKPTAVMTDAQARELADQIMVVSPGDVKCAPRP